MDSNKSARRGRPPSAAQTMPLFLGPARSRVEQTVIMSSPTSRELRSYVDWASGVALMTDDEVLIRTVDHALGEYFRNDKAWQKERGEFLAAAAAPGRPSGKNGDAAAAATPGKEDARPAAQAAGAGGKVG